MKLAYYQYFQFISVCTGFLLFPAVKRSAMVWLLLFCTWGVAIELLAWLWINSWGAVSNYVIYNLYILVAAPVLYYGFDRKMQLNSRNKIRYRISAILLLLFYGVDYLFITGSNEMTTLSVILFYFTAVLLAIGMLFKMALGEEAVSMEIQPVFWACAGFLIFGMGALVTLGLNQYIRMNHITIQNKTLYRIIMPMLNVVFSLFITYAFILCRPRKKSYSPSLSSF